MQLFLIVPAEIKKLYFWQPSFKGGMVVSRFGQINFHLDRTVTVILSPETEQINPKKQKQHDLGVEASGQEGQGPATSMCQNQDGI